MANNVKISQFPTDDALTGSELLTGIDGNENINISIQQIADFVIALIGGGGSGDQLILADTGDTLIIGDTGDTLILA